MLLQLLVQMMLLVPPHSRDYPGFPDSLESSFLRRNPRAQRILMLGVLLGAHLQLEVRKVLSVLACPRLQPLSGPL